MTTVNITDDIGNLIHRHRWIDNGHVPHPLFYRAVAGGIDRAGFYLGKTLFRAGGNLKAIPAAGGDRQRWRCAFRTGKFTRGVYVYMAMALVGAGAPASKFTLEMVDSLTFNYGNSGSPTDVPGELGHFFGFINCSPASDYTGYFEDIDGGRLALAVLYEAKEALDTDNGYLPLQHSVNEPIFDRLRESAMPLATDLWKENGAARSSWSAGTASGVRTRTSTTDINLLDNSSTTVTTSTPGWTLDNRYRNTASKSTVPYVFKAYSKVAGGNGHIYLKNSAGTVLATLTTTSTTGAWTSTTVNLPNTEAKYDVHFDGDGANLHTVEAVTLYEKG